MRFRISLLVTAVVLMFATISPAQNNCTAGIVDKAGVIRNSAIIGSAARPLVNQGVDVRVVTVDHNTFVQNGSSLAGVETYIESVCPNWIDSKTGIRKANLFVVMVAPQDRQKNIFLGSYYAGSFDIPSTYSQLANTSFKAGQWETGIANTLNGTGSRAIAFRQQVAAQQRQRAVQPVAPPVRAYTQPVTSYPTQQADSGMSGVLIFFLVLLFLGVVATILYFVFRTSDTVTTSSTSSYDPAEFTTSSSSSVPRYASSAPRRYAASAPSSTVVVHEHYDSPRYDSSGNLITGMLIGEALSRNNQPQQVIYENNPAPVYNPAPSYVPDSTPAAPVADAPDSTWEPGPVQSAPDTNFETPSYEAPSEPSYTPDPPSSDFGSSNDSGF